MKSIELVFASDDRYFTGLVGTLFSLLVNAGGRYHYNVSILDGGISEVSKQKLANSVQRIKDKRVSVDYLSIDLTFYKNSLPVFFFDSLMTYARLIIPDVIRKDKVIYIDSDILFLKDIDELWNIDFQGKSSLVCLEKVISILANDFSGDESDDFDLNSPYFNAGLIVMDLKRFRKRNISQRTLQHLIRDGHKCTFHDQSALNIMLYNDFRLLDQSWNTQSHRNAFKIEEGFADFLTYELNYHFVTKNKPWIIYNEELPNLFFRALLGWIGWKYETAPFLLSKKKFEREQKIASLFPIWLRTKNAFYRLIGKKDFADKLDKLVDNWKDRNAMYSFLASKRNEVEVGLVSWERKVNGLFN